MKHAATKVAVTLAATTLVLWSCGGAMMMTMKPTVTVKLGAVLDQTGTSATPSFSSSIDLAVAQANAALEASGDALFGSTRFSMTYSDSQNNPEVAKSRATALVTDAGVAGLMLQTAPLAIGVNSLNYLADGGAPLNVPIMCGNCILPSINNPNTMDTNPELQAGARDPNNWLFRSVAANDKDALIIVRILTAMNNGDANNDGKFKIAIYSASGAAFNSFRTGIETAAKAVRADAIVEKGVLFPMTLNVNTYDFNADIAKLVDSNNEDTMSADVVPDAIVELSAAGIAAAFTKAYKTRNETIRLIHNTNFRNPTALDTLKDQANGQEGTSPVIVENNTSGSTFATDYKAATALDPFLQDSNFYDGTMAMMLATLVAMKTNNLTDASAVTPAQIRDGLLAISATDGEKVGTGVEEFKKAIGFISSGKTINYDGASGPLDFSATGDVKGRIVSWKVENQKFVDVDRYDCVADPTCPKQ